MFCSNCGKEVPDGSKFCTNCGAPLGMSRPAADIQKQAPEKQLEIRLELPHEAQPVQKTPDIELNTEPDLVLPPFDVGIEPPKEEAAGVRPAPAGAAPGGGKDAAAAYAASGAKPKAATSRDSRGKYIVKRLIFFGIAIIIAVVGAFLLKAAFPGMGIAGYGIRTIDRIFMYLGTTLILLLVPLIIAFIIGMLAGLAKGNGAKNVVRVISVILRAFVPMSLAYMLLEAFGILGRILPVHYDSGLGMVMPLLCLILPLAGFLMNAAVSNGHRTTFAGGIGAVAAWIADHIILIVLAEVIVERIFTAPGIGYLAISAFAQMDISMIFGSVLVLMILTYLLRLLNDVIASLTAGGDPTEQVFGARGRGKVQAGTLSAGELKEVKSGKGLLIAGIIFAGLVLIIAIVMKVTATFDPVQMDYDASLFAPGQGGHILGTDQFGRDIYALLGSGVLYTVIAALVNVVIAIILGVGFGLLAGFLRGAGAEVFKAIRYVFGFGAPLAIMILIIYSMKGTILPLLFLPGLYGWGGIADRLAGAIRAKKAHPGEKTALILPVLEQVVHSFCMAVIAITIMGMSGLVYSTPSFMTLGTLLASSMTYLMVYPFLAVAPAFALTILLAAFFLLHAGLSARERHLK